MQSSCLSQEKIWVVQSSSHFHRQLEEIQAVEEHEELLWKLYGNVRRVRLEVGSTCRVPPERTWHEQILARILERARAAHLWLLCSVESLRQHGLWTLHSLCPESVDLEVVRIRWFASHRDQRLESWTVSDPEFGLQLILQKERLAREKPRKHLGFWSPLNKARYVLH